MKTNELAFLKANHVKPVAWRLTVKDGLYTLDFTYLKDSEYREILVGDKWVSPWNQLHTRRGEPKQYKTSDAAIKDINSVQGDCEAVVYLRYEDLP